MLMVSPNSPRARMAARNEPGMAMPTSSALRTPRMPMMTMNTSNTADSTLFCRSVSMLRTSRDLSREVVILTPSGHKVLSSATTACTCSMVLMILAPDRLTTSRAIACSPLIRA